MVSLGRIMRCCLAFLLIMLSCSWAAEHGLTASQLAAQMAAAVEDGDSTARVRMKNSDGKVLQVRIKSRRTNGRAETVYEILWPAERKGEKVVLRQTKGAWPEGETIAASGQRAKIDRGDLGEGVFGTALSYADVIENFFLWPKQQFAGTEMIGGAECAILESRPSGASPHGKVRSWIDAGKLVVHRVEKYDTLGGLLRTITTTQVAKDDTGRNVPAGMTVTRTGGSSTEIDGSNIRHDVKLTGADFAP